MAADPRIPMMVNTQQMDPGATIVRGLQLKNLVGQNRAQEIATQREGQRRGMLAAGAGPLQMAMMGFDKTAKNLQEMYSAGIQDAEKLGTMQDALLAQAAFVTGLSPNPERIWPKVRRDIIMSAFPALRGQLNQILPQQYDGEWVSGFIRSQMPEEMQGQVFQALDEARAEEAQNRPYDTGAPAPGQMQPAPGMPPGATPPQPVPGAVSPPVGGTLPMPPGQMQMTDAVPPAGAEPQIGAGGTIPPAIDAGRNPITGEEAASAGLETMTPSGEPEFMQRPGQDNRPPSNVMGDVAIPEDEAEIVGPLKPVKRWIDARMRRYDTLTERADAADRKAAGAMRRGNTFVAEKQRELAQDLRDEAERIGDFQTERVVHKGKVYNVPRQFANQFEAEPKKALIEKGAVNVSPNITYGDLSKTAQSRIDVGLLEAGQQKARMFEMQKLFRPEFTEYMTRAKMASLGVAEKAGKEISQEDRQIMGDFHQWKSGALSALNAYIKAITGAALSEAEAKRIRAAFPDPGEGIFDGDSATEFQQKLYTAMKNARMAEARYHYIKKHGLEIRRTGEDGWDAGGLDLEDMPHLINERGAVLEAQFKKEGLQGRELEDAVRNELAEEFGLS